MLTFTTILELETIIDGSLYAIHWEDEKYNSLEQMAISFNDSEYFYSYFHTNERELKHYTNPSFTPQEAAISTLHEADTLIQELKTFATNGNSTTGKSLDDLFEPLHSKTITHPRYYTDVKAKGHPSEAPWLRVYAIKCDENLYVITGFGMKLIRDMRNDTELIKELKKLDNATRFLDSIQMITR